MAVKISTDESGVFMQGIAPVINKNKKHDPNLIALPNGNRVSLTDAEYGAYVRDNFMVLNFLWIDYFSKYRDSHNMTEVMENLKKDVDDISIEYLDRHERLLDLVRSNKFCLVDKHFAWTEEDFKRMAYFEACKQKNKYLSKILEDSATAYTNCYGLYDLPSDVFSGINGKAVIDAGAFVGDSIDLVRDYFPDSVCYCFEPDPRNIRYLEAMYSEDIEKGKVKSFNQGLGDKPGILQLNRIESIPQANPSSSFFYDYGGDKQGFDNRALNSSSGETDQGSVVDVKVRTIDEVVDEYNLNLGLIKMDVEGFEPQVVKGALNTLRTQRPVLAISIYHSPEEFYELKPFLESLNLGYKFKIRRSSGYFVPMYEIVLIAYHD